MKQKSPDEYMSTFCGSARHGKHSNYLGDGLGAAGKVQRIRAEMEQYHSKGKAVPESLWEEERRTWSATRAMDRHYAPGGMTIVRDGESDDGLPV